MKTIRYEDQIKAPQKHEIVSGIFLRPITKEELFERNKIDSELPVSADFFYFQTSNPGFLWVEYPDTPLYSVYDQTCPADCLMFYWNMTYMMRQAGISLDIATRTFSNLNNKNVYSRFIQGHGYSFLNVRLVAEFIAAFSLTREEVSMMLSGPILATSKPYVEKINKNRIGTKSMVAEELSKLLDQVEVNPLMDGVLDDKIMTAIRAGISGRSYMHLDEFLPLMRYCGVDPVSAICSCQNLGVQVEDDGESVFCKMRNSMGQDLDAYHHVVEVNKDSDNVIMGLITQSYVNSPNNSQDNLLCFRHNMEYIKEHHAFAFEALKEILTEKNLSFDLILDFISKATGIETTEIMTGTLFIPDSEEETTDESVKNTLNNEEQMQGTTQREVPEMTVQEGMNAEYVRITTDQKREAISMELVVKVKHRCSARSWKNENPNKLEEGYYWGEVSENEKDILKDRIQEIPVQELSIERVKEFMRHFYQSEVKVFLSIKQDFAELSFGFST